ncbi:DinB family protein [Polaribacter vadi]|uniref:DinB family protein n=1 Tax=Polaribacter TaxID=52959 RepID=UPI001C08BED1|nr:MULTISPECIES: DinB family protein [Polaribacter]MBU3010090.1 DinB family protein [Polaribacter vadi]MDO6739897.1 DinB family protein [Polaribacter sp. 1_MG-2023]
MIAAIEENLQRGIKLLSTISDDEYSNNTIPPYFSSIGCHMRHILDVFTCVFNGFSDRIIDLTLRERNESIELYTTSGIAYFNSILKKIKNISEKDLITEVTVIDDLGKGKVSSRSTLGAVLMQTQSHAIHHFASVGYIINQLEIELPDSDFGYNPSTPKKVEN